MLEQVANICVDYRSKLYIDYPLVKVWCNILNSLVKMCRVTNEQYP